MYGLLNDIRYALRQFLRRSPGFTLVAILTLALGIGATTIIFSVIYNGVLYPFPYRGADRLTAILVQDTQNPDRGHGDYHLDEVAAFRNGNRTFEDILAYGLWYVTYARRSSVEMLKGVGATPNFMEFWGIPPLLGRGFSEHDVQPGAPPVALLNYRFWKREFQGDKNIIGTTMMINGKDRTIIGVMPPRFQAVGAELYMPISWTRPEPVHQRFEWNVDDPLFFWATGILKPGVSLETAATDIDVTAHQLAHVHPDDYPKSFRATTRKLNDLLFGTFKRTLFFLFAPVTLVLIISCGNVAGLLLAHASARTKEIAVRAALGANRKRIVRQLLSESIVLGTAGCIAGSLLAYVGLEALKLTHLEVVLPMEASISLNLPAMIFCLGISLLATLLCGLAPALHAIRGDVQKGLASTGMNVNAAFQHNRFRSGLVIGEVALSLLLLTCAGFVSRSYFALANPNLGIRPERTFTAAIHFPRGRYTKAEEKTAFFERLLPELRSMPGVVSATTLMGMPPFFAPSGDVTIPGRPHREAWETGVELCSEGYFQTTGLRLLRGRLLTANDILSARKVVVVNEKLAQKYFSGEDPIGRQIKFNVLNEFPETPHDAYFEIVGVVSDSRNYDLQEGVMVPRGPEMSVPEGFVPYSLSGFGDRFVAMQTRVPPDSLVNSLRQIVWHMDRDVILAAPDLAGATGFSLEELMRGLVYGKRRFTAIAFGVCAGLGFVLAVIGLFSLMTYIVSLQTHDIGVRLALGASRPAILELMLKRGLVLTGTGIAIGLLMSIGIARLLSSQLHGVSAADPLTFIVVIPTIIFAGLFACYMPARRATKVDPIVALRYE